MTRCSTTAHNFCRKIWTWADHALEAILSTVSPSVPLCGRTVLVVEDQYLIALEAQSMVEAAGAGRVYLAKSTAEAISLIEAEAIDVAIVDLFLAEGTTAELMSRLRLLAIPFVIASGYDSPELVAVTAPLVRKPYLDGDLIPAMMRAIGR